jgi:hypothetical protein
MNTAGKVVMFDTSRPSHPRVLKVLDLGANSGPHYIALTDDERRLVISTTLLNEDSFGKVHTEGDHHVHVARVTSRDLILTRGLTSTSIPRSQLARPVHTASLSSKSLSALTCRRFLTVSVSTVALKPKR